jgi:ABC-type spermidine/putrescine transport system permease subunit I
MTFRDGMTLPSLAMAKARLRRPSGSLRLALLMLPALLLFLLFFGIPIVRLLMLGFESGFQHYEKALTGEVYQKIFLLTFKVSLLVTAITFVLGYPVAYWLSTTTPRWRAIGFALILLPLWTSILVRTYAWMVLLGRNGVVNQLLQELGLIETPIGFLYDFSGVLIGMVHVLLPFMILPLYAAFMRLDRRLVEAAAGLGAGGWSICTRIYLPLTRNGIIAGCSLVFVTAIGFFITPALLGGGRVIMIAPLIDQQVRQVMDWPFASALAGILLVLTILIYTLMNWAVDSRETRRR